MTEGPGSGGAVRVVATVTEEKSLATRASRLCQRRSRSVREHTAYNRFIECFHMKETALLK